MLLRGLQREAPAHRRLGTLAAPAQPHRAAGRCRDIAVLDPVAVSSQHAHGHCMLEVEQAAIERALARKGIDGLVPRNAVDPVQPVHLQSGSGARGPFGEQGIEGLLVLPPADVADEPLVVDGQALTSGANPNSGPRHPSQAWLNSRARGSSTSG